MVRMLLFSGLICVPVALVLAAVFAPTDGQVFGSCWELR